MVEPLPRQLVRPRPIQLETPGSYLTRICAANVIDVKYIERLAIRRRTITRRGDELGYIIEELGGPARNHFQQEFQRAGGWPKRWLREAHAFTPNTPRRQACSHCSAGEPAFTFYHRKFMVCRKHGRWLGAHANDAQQTAGPETIDADRRLRRIAAAGLVSILAYDRLAVLLNAHLTGTTKPPSAASSVPSDSLVQFPSQVNLLELVTDSVQTRYPVDEPLPAWHSRPEQERLRRHMRPGLIALNLAQGRDGDVNRLLEGMVEVAIDMLSERTDYAAGF